MLQGGTPVIPAWAVVTLLATIALAVLGSYGTLILFNRSAVQNLKHRLFGMEGDDTYDGHITETEDRLECIEEKMEQHAEQTHTTLYRLDKKLDTVVGLVADEHNVDMPPEIREDEVPPPPGNDFYRGGGSGAQGPSPGHPPDRDDGPPASDD